MFKKMFVLFISLLLLPSTVADRYESDIIGDGAISSYVNFNDLGTYFRTSQGQFGLGVQLTDSTLFSGAELYNSSDGVYRSWGKIGEVSHSIALSNLLEMYGTSVFAFELNPINDTVDQTVESFYTGQTAMNINYTGYGVEKVRGVTIGSKGNKPLEIGTVRANGTIQVNSKVII